MIRRAVPGPHKGFAVDDSPFAPLFARQRGYFQQPELERLAGSRVAVLGLGGVGGVAAELLARAGVGADGDQRRGDL